MADAPELIVGVIEWGDDSIDVDAVIGTTLEEARRQVRTIIEDFYGSYEDGDGGYGSDPVWEYVRSHHDVVEWADWHEPLHELDGTPWVTFMDRKVDD